MPGPEFTIRQVGYDDPDAVKLIAELQQEYVVRYGGHDATPVAVEDFAPPRGLFVVGCLGDSAVACGGWRAHSSSEDFTDGDAEVKRMYVTPPARGLGLARAVLAELERTAREHGRRRIVLETGTEQPEAIGLYTSSGYTPVPHFGTYRDSPSSRYFGKVL
ncbi:MAG TPA: GNAT family N-acetyltransferase [Pseudonocardiaceae bacterium]|nr:GNAT family N-acetyltransferase [Pseudonocardiaceae bacterium]